jgi:hypothetical protein
MRYLFSQNYGGSDTRELGLRVESIELLVDEIVTPD